MKYVMVFTFLWSVVIIAEMYNARGEGFTALACIALAAIIIRKLESK